MHLRIAIVFCAAILINVELVEKAEGQTVRYRRVQNNRVYTQPTNRTRPTNRHAVTQPLPFKLGNGSNFGRANESKNTRTATSQSSADQVRSTKPSAKSGNQWVTTLAPKPRPTTNSTSSGNSIGALPSTTRYPRRTSSTRAPAYPRSRYRRPNC